MNLRIKLNGWYQIIYCDHIKYGGHLKINDDTNNVILYSSFLAYTNNFMQFTINCIFKMVINKNKRNFFDIGITVDKPISGTKTPILEGTTLSNFYIKYLRPI